MLRQKPATATTARAGTARRRRKARAIDVHSHIRIPAVLDFVRANPVKAKGPGTDDWFAAGSAADLKGRDQRAGQWARLTDPRTRMRTMDRMGVEVQVVSSNFPVSAYWAEGRKGLAIARINNDGIAAFVAREPRRFAGLASVPLQDARLAARELERAVGELDLRGAWIASNIRGRDLGEKPFWPFWAKAEELGVPVFIHPLGFTDLGRFRKFFLWNTIGQPLEEALAFASLVYEGAMDAFPEVKIVICHGGGYLPFYSGRADRAWEMREDARGALKRRPSEYLRRFYYDTAVFRPDLLAYLAGTVGADRILLGTDWPLSPAESDPIAFVNAAKGLSSAAKEKILWRNAAKLLRIRV